MYNSSPPYVTIKMAAATYSVFDCYFLSVLGLSYVRTQAIHASEHSNKITLVKVDQSLEIMLRSTLART